MVVVSRNVKFNHFFLIFFVHTGSSNWWKKNNRNIKLIKENENEIQIIVRIYFVDHEKKNKIQLILKESEKKS